MGKGDRKSKKGKIFRKSQGNSRPRPQKLRQLRLQKSEAEKKSTKE